MNVGAALIGEHAMTVISSSVSASSGLALLQALAQSAQSQTSGGAQANSTQSDTTASSATEAFQVIAANDPANAIKAILAQAQIEQAQAGISSGGSASSVTVAAAYAAQTGGSSSFLSTNVTISLPGTVSGLDDHDNPVGSSASFMVATASGSSSVTIGNQDQEDTAYQENAALGSYQYLTAEAVPELQAESLVSASAAGISSASAAAVTADSNGTSQAGQSVLVLTIGVVDDWSAFKDGVDAQAAVQAQRLVSDFENNTLSPASTNATGFSLAENFGGADVTITGTEVSNWGGGLLTGWVSQGEAIQTEDIQNEGAFQDLINQSAQIAGNAFNGTGQSSMAFVIPLGSS
jgi:hypothetical protein